LNEGQSIESRKFPIAARRRRRISRSSAEGFRHVGGNVVSPHRTCADHAGTEID
jgi:hypothetical protein